MCVPKGCHLLLLKDRKKYLKELRLDVGKGRYLHVAKTSNIRKRELITRGNFRNLRTENYFMDLSSSNIQSKITIKNIYNIMCTIEYSQ